MVLSLDVFSVLPLQLDCGSRTPSPIPAPNHSTGREGVMSDLYI